MSIVCTTPYTPPPDPPVIDDTVLPIYGVGRISPDDYNQSHWFQPILTQTHDDFKTNPTVNFKYPFEDEYYYYLVPKSMGKVEFRDINGWLGGWDGASWPLDDMADTLGPVEVYYNGIIWDLYRTDWPGSWQTTFTVTFLGDV